MIKKSRQLNLGLLFVAVALLLIASFVFIFALGISASRVADDVRQRQSVVQRLEAVAAATGDAETGQRGYLLTGEETYLAPYTNALSEMHTRLSDLQKAADEGFVSSEDVDRINRLVSAKLSELAQTVDLARQNRRQDALAV